MVVACDATANRPVGPSLTAVVDRAAQMFAGEQFVEDHVRRRADDLEVAHRVLST
jgi:hypothetical protein